MVELSWLALTESVDHNSENNGREYHLHAAFVMVPGHAFHLLMTMKILPVASGPFYDVGTRNQREQIKGSANESNGITSQYSFCYIHRSPKFLYRTDPDRQ